MIGLRREAVNGDRDSLLTPTGLSRLRNGLISTCDSPHAAL